MDRGREEKSAQFLPAWVSNTCGMAVPRRY